MKNKEQTKKEFRTEQKQLKRLKIWKCKLRKLERRRIRKVHWKTRKGSTFRT